MNVGVGVLDGVGDVVLVGVIVAVCTFVTVGLGSVCVGVGTLVVAVGESGVALACCSGYAAFVAVGDLSGSG